MSAGSVAVGLVAGMGAVAMPAAGAVEPVAQAAEPEIVLSEDFEDGDWSPLARNGEPTLSVVDADGDKALLVAGRANDYDGVKTPAGLLEAGRDYTFSAQMRLAAGTAPTSARFVVEPAYTWVGNTVVTADAWTTVTGTFAAPAGADPATLRAYIGTASLSAAYDYLVDDVVITGEGGDTTGPWTPTPDPTFVPGGALSPTTTPLASARGAGDVAALTFDDGPNPGETERLLDFLAANDIQAVFCVIGQNITAPGGAEILQRIVAEGHTLCNHSTSYADMGGFTHAQVEADLKANLEIIREALGDPEQPVPYFRAPNGSWGVTGEVAAALGMQPLGLGNIIFDWDGNDLSEATLTQKLRDAFRPGAVVLVHDGGGNRENSIAAVETVVSEKLAAGWTFTLPTGGAPEPVEVTTGFEDGVGGWVPRGAAQIAHSTTDAHTGSGSLLVTDRLQSWQGAALDVTDVLTVGQAVEISVWAKLAPGGPDQASLKMSVQRDVGGSQGYDGVAGASATVTADAWTQLKGTYTLGAPVDSALVYVEGDAGVDFLIDDFALRAIIETPIQRDIPALKDVLGEAGIERVGVAVDARETVGRAAQLVRKHYDAITPENAGKPESVQRVEGEFTFGQLDQLLDFADATGLDVYGHVLVWHSQTPAWFFTRPDGTPLTSSPEDQALLRQRMETHIAAIADHINARYPDGDSPIWAWDVVNEVIADGDTDNPHDMRDSRWFQVLGEGFVDEAFRLADRYFPDAQLFINDYNTEMPEKRADYLSLIAALQARGVPIDGVGHQAHVDFARPISWLEDSIEAVEALDPSLLQVITELDVNASTENPGADVSNPNNPPYTPVFSDPVDAGVEVGYYYRDLFAMLREHAEDIDSVTFWGISNARSWLRTWPTARPYEQPLPFDDDLQAAPAYWGIVDPSRLPERPADILPPRIASRSDVTAAATDSRGAVVTYALPEAGDTQDGPVTPTCTLPSGSRFPVGTTTVTCTAQDSKGNQATPSAFDVVVTAPSADLRTVVTGPTSVRASAWATYQVRVTNDGPATAEGLTVVLDNDGLREIPATGGAKAVGSATVWTVPSLAPGESAAFRVTGKVAVKKGGTLTVSGTTTAVTADPDAADNSDAMSTRVTR